jgi:hypothetical protein
MHICTHDREELNTIKSEIQSNFDISNEDKKKEFEIFSNDIQCLHEKYGLDIQQYELNIEEIKAQNIDNITKIQAKNVTIISEFHDKYEHEKQEIIKEKLKIITDTDIAYIKLQEDMKNLEIEINIKNGIEYEKLKVLMDKNETKKVFLENEILEKNNEILVFVELEGNLKISNSNLYELIGGLEDLNKKHLDQVY